MESPVGWRCSQRRGAYKRGIIASTRNEKKNGRPAAGMRNPHHKDIQIFRNPANFPRKIYFVPPGVRRVTVIANFPAGSNPCES